MNVLLLGATGLVGGECLKYGISDPAVTAIRIYSRSPVDSAGGKITVLTAPLDAMEQHGGFFAADALVCALGTTIKKAGSQEAFRHVDHDYPVMAARLAKANGCRHYLLVSAIGADSGSSVFYNRVKGETEEAIQSVGFERTTIIRPSLLLGDRKEFRFGEWMGQWFTPLIPKKYKPVRATAVARTLMNALHRNDTGVRIIESRDIWPAGSILTIGS
jgi:uncharacterized protein YbjT (DUF2867 family)